MKKIKLSNGSYAIVDDEDFEKLSKYNWHIRENGYAVANIPYRGPDGMVIKRKSERMHRMVMGNPENMFIDHANHNPLDNRKINLRIVKQNQNMWNLTKHKDGKSKYKGVSLDSRRKKWLAKICKFRKQKFIGYFLNEEEAAIAYNLHAKEMFGEYAFLNKIS